ncbi:MAG TPA: carbohydrate ABC transporter substrate-binding protein, partial [Microbacterium sp.]|nr:carbohydrate ABC transporter substrate-binding protein [Microbacterium sp.]
MRVSRRLAAIGTVLAVGALLASCSGGGGGASDAEVEGTLNYYMNKGAWEPNFEALNTLSDDQVGIDLDISSYSDAPQYQAFIKQSFRTQ